MSDFKKLTELNDLEDEFRIAIKSQLFSSFIDNTFESHVSLSGNINTREEIAQKTEEDVQVISNNLWNVEVSQGSHEQALLGKMRLSTLERTGDDQHGLDSSQTPIVVSCLREQITAQEVKHCELCGQSLGLDETLSHEHVLANELEIWNDYSNRSEEGLETFGELGTTKIAGVHSDEGTASRVEADFIILQEEALLAFLNGIEYSFELHGAH